MYGSGNHHLPITHQAPYSNTFEPTLLAFFDNKNIVNVVSGSNHSLILCEDGLYGFGENRAGQLGVGMARKVYREATLIPFFENKTVLSLHAGKYISIVETAEGFYGFGDNRRGALGLEEPVVYNTPTKIEFAEKNSLTLQGVLTLTDFTYFVTNEGIYGSGHNQKQQLGFLNNGLEYQFTPIKLTIFDEIVEDVLKAMKDEKALKKENFHYHV